MMQSKQYKAPENAIVESSPSKFTVIINIEMSFKILSMSK